MLSLVATSGTRRGLKSTPWPKCLLAPGCSGRRVINDEDAEGVPRVRYPGAPRAKRTKGET